VQEKDRDVDSIVSSSSSEENESESVSSADPKNGIEYDRSLGYVIYGKRRYHYESYLTATHRVDNENDVEVWCELKDNWIDSDIVVEAVGPFDTDDLIYFSPHMGD